jgi:hypothetical protein
LDPVSTFPETIERPGYFVEFADNVEDAVTFKILKNDLVTILHRSVVRSAADANHRNKSVSYKSDVQESLQILHTNPISTFFKKIVIIGTNQERLIMICLTELGLIHIEQTSMLAIELRLRYTTQII